MVKRRFSSRYIATNHYTWVYGTKFCRDLLGIRCMWMSMVVVKVCDGFWWCDQPSDSILSNQLGLGKIVSPSK
jgi:hypothetical protein